MQIQKIDIKKIIPDKQNLRTTTEEIQELAESIEKNGQEIPLKVEDIGKNKYLIRDGHRRHAALKIIQKKKNKPVTAICVVENKLTDEERLVKRCIIDNQQKNLNVEERDKAWKKVWEIKKKPEAKEFAKTLGVTTEAVRHFFDRMNLDPGIKKLKVNSGILQETISLPSEKRKSIITYAHKKGMGAMRLRQDVRVLKNASNTLVNAYTKDQIDVDTVKKLSGLSEEKQKTAIENISKMKNTIKKMPGLVKKGKVKPVSEKEKKKMTAYEFVSKLNHEIAETSNQVQTIQSVIEEIEENELDKFFTSKMKESLSEYLKELSDNINTGLKTINKVRNKWKKESQE